MTMANEEHKAQYQKAINVLFDNGLSCDMFAHVNDYVNHLENHGTYVFCADMTVLLFHRKCFVYYVFLLALDLLYTSK